MTFFTHDKTLNFVLWISYTACLSLLAIITLDTWAAPQHFWKAWLLQSLPILLLVPGLLMKHYRSHSWLCFLMLAYFTSYVIQVYSPSRLWYDWAGLILAVTLFIASMFASRWLQRL